MTRDASSPPCPRSWEVEAVRDGRLGERDAASLARHLETCAACAEEQRRLDELTRDFARLPSPRLDAVAGRRIRQRVLADHNAWLFAQDRPASRRLALSLAAALLVLGAGAAWRFAAGHRAKVALVAAEPPKVEVVASADARWSRRSAPHEVRIALETGELELTIKRHAPTDRVFILLPDGEIEDVGTVLTVTSHGGVTEAVRVAQGRVVLRLRDRPPLALAAGESFERAAPAVTQPVAPARPEEASDTASSAASANDRPEARRRPPVPPVSHRAAASVASAPEVPTAAPPVSSAQAATPLAEDDAYLHVVELVREGRVEDARAAAKSYLLRFPNGFRRVEVLDIATRAAP
ncbi:MAG TPA: hypothetical protein VMI54_12900 [Polyangiaceae bacterium]|nr:hypothetical protein [Polyangiaceae bacterium]